MIAQAGLARAGNEPERLRAALGVKPGGHRQRLHQGRLTGAIVADQECHPWIQVEHTPLRQVLHHRQGERVTASVGAGIESDLAHEPAGHAASGATHG